MASANKKNKNLTAAGLASAAIHGLILALGCLNIFEPQINNDMFVNVELAGAAELQQALDDYDNRPVAEQIIPEPEIIKPKEIESEQPVNESLSESHLKSPQEDVSEDQLVKGPRIVEPIPEPEPEPAPEPEPELEEESEQDSENVLPPELQNEKTLHLEKEKLEQEKIEKEKQERLQREQEEKRRLEKERRKKLREEKLKKKKEAARRRKKRLDAIKKLEKKNKARKNRLSKIADAVKKNQEEKKRKDEELKKKKSFAFDQMLKKEKKNLNKSPLNRSSYGRLNSNGMGNGNGLGSYGDGMGFTDSDAAIISSQIIPHWVVAGGVKNAETLTIRIRIKVKDNGEVPASSIEIIDKARYNSDHVFKSAADSAKRAILKASPLKIPAEKMHLFRDFEFSFNTDKALGVKR